MTWTRISAAESRIRDARGGNVARVWLAAGGWIGAAAGEQSGAMDGESAARDWCETAMGAKVSA